MKRWLPVALAFSMAMTLVACDDPSSGPVRNAAVSTTVPLEWEIREPDIGYYFNSIVHTSRGYVLIDHAGGRTASSSDGLQWQVVEQPSGYRLPHIIYGYVVTQGDGRLVAVPVRGYGPPYYSDDGITWTAGRLRPVDNEYSSFNSWYYRGGSRTPCDRLGWAGVFYLDGKFWGSFSGRILVSSDAVEWIDDFAMKQDTGFFLDQATCFRTAAVGNGVTVALGHAGPSGGRTWYGGKGVAFQQSNLTHDAVDVAFGNGVFVAVGYTGISVSSDGETWTREPTGALGGSTVVFDAGRFIVAGRAGLSTSADGLTWVSEPVSMWGPFSAVAAASGRIVAVSPNMRLVFVSVEEAASPSIPTLSVVPTSTSTVPSTTPEVAVVSTTVAPVLMNPTIPFVARSLRVKKSITIALSGGRNVDGLVTTIRTSSKTCRVASSSKGYVVTGLSVGKCVLQISVAGDARYRSSSVSRQVTVTK